MSEVVFPQVERAAVEIPTHLRARFEIFIAERGWTPEEGVKILLAYAADVLTSSERSAEQIHNEWSAARGEMAILRHRAYLADEAIRTLRLNIAGLEASNSQYQRSLAIQRARRDRLRQAVAALEASLSGRSFELPPTRNRSSGRPAAGAGGQEPAAGDP